MLVSQLITDEAENVFSFSWKTDLFKKQRVFFPVSKTSYSKKPETNTNVWFLRKIKCYTQPI